MTINPSYEELEQRVRDLETETLESKRANEALRVSALAWQVLFDAVTDSVFLIDSEGKILLCNKATVNFLGKPINEIVGNTCWELVHATSGPIKGCPIVRMRETRRPESLELPAGDRVLYVATHPILDQDGNLASAVHIITDITERKRAEETLRESEVKYRQLFTTVSDAIMVFDAETKEFIDANDAVSSFYGYSKEEFLELKQTDITAELKKSNDSIKKTVSGEISSIPLRYHKRKDGTIFPVEISTGAFTLGKRQMVFGVARNITERKQAEEALQKAHNELEQRVKERTRDLELKTIKLDEINIAMKVLLEQSETHKKELEEKILYNIKELVDPYLEKLERCGSDVKKVYLSIIKSNIDEIISPFTRKLSNKYLKLTPSEIRIANLVKQGKTKKEMAGILNISGKTVGFHRENIRKKLGLKNKKANLRSHLLSLQ